MWKNNIIRLYVSNMKEELIKLPKVELHLHLDGAVSIDLASKLTNLSIGELKNKMIAKDKCLNLS